MERLLQTRPSFSQPKTDSKSTDALKKTSAHLMIYLTYNMYGQLYLDLENLGPLHRFRRDPDATLLHQSLSANNCKRPGIRQQHGSTNDCSSSPYVVACVACISAGLAGDKDQTTRHILHCLPQFLAIIGSSMLLASTNNGCKYAGTFFLASGIYPNVPAYVAWNGKQHWRSQIRKEALEFAMQVGMQNILPCRQVSNKPYSDRKFGWMHVGIYVSCKRRTSIQTRPCCSSWLLRHGHHTVGHLDRLVPQGKFSSRRYLPQPSVYTDEERYRERGLGDDASFFRYTI